MIQEYIQTWGEACTYAKECLPPFFYDIWHEITYHHGEPWSMLATIALVCYSIYRYNERNRFTSR